MLFVLFEDVLQFGCGLGIENKAVHLVIEEEAAGIEIRASYGAESSVNHHDL